MNRVFEYNLVISRHLMEFEHEIKYAFGYINLYYNLKLNSAADRSFYYGGPQADMQATFFEEYVMLDKGRYKTSSGQITSFREIMAQTALNQR